MVGESEDVNVGLSPMFIVELTLRLWKTLVGPDIALHHGIKREDTDQNLLALLRCGTLRRGLPAGL